MHLRLIYIRRHKSNTFILDKYSVITFVSIGEQTINNVFNTLLKNNKAA